ncbi:MAG: ribosome maturation factor RimP [Gammaproteobacteria bacterium]|nr:ribosome maturation factor RimP [Gammaproteobacteria bacterium]
MLSKTQIDNILQSTIESLGFEYICSELANTGKKGGAVIRIFIDSMAGTGITLGDCELVNKQVSRVLDVETSAVNAPNAVNGLGSATSNFSLNFSLEVSSPGLDRPLVKLEHFKRFINKKVKIKLHTGVNNHISTTPQKNIVGYIKDVVPEGSHGLLGTVIVSSADSDIIFELDLDNIHKANLVPEW